MIKDLIKIADQLDSAGFFREADQIDWVVNRLVIQSNILKMASEDDTTEEPLGDMTEEEASTRRGMTPEEARDFGSIEFPYSYEEPINTGEQISLDSLKEIIQKMSPEQRDQLMGQMIYMSDSNETEEEPF